MMKDFWDERYGEEGLAYGETPNVYLSEITDQITDGGSVLVVGDGEGRNGVWLAKQGFDVTCIDYSPVAIDKINAFASQNAVSVNTICADMNEWNWPREKFDAVVSIYVHFPLEVRATLHQKMVDALKSGGKILMEAFNKDQLQYKSGGPPVFEMLFSEAMLREDFSSVDILEMEEKVVYLDEGKYHCGDGAVVRMIAQKR